MEIQFWKVEAAGNDFIIIDYRTPFFSEKLPDVAIRLTDRRLGIGADGIILIESHPDVDFFMGYYNADGSGPVMCGNGSRASLYFVYESAICRKEQYRFLASDGLHLGHIQNGKVSLTINQPGNFQSADIGSETVYLVDTGVPHMIRFSENISDLDIYAESPKLRKQYNANINYIEKIGESNWKIRTYERGVEDETLACGTGATAAAVTINRISGDPFPIKLQARGGDLSIDKNMDKLWLTGPVRKVYEGNLLI
ncbi:MAG: diaminopimelate epimerase [Candidatus Marinimicrobia bacterium]|nr:diaminopimelate epimerase [Candidatus Neomarinimicrobiota bacterium]